MVIRERGAGQRNAAARAAADRREQIRPVLAYVDRHCRESITLEDVAEVVHVSPSRVRHVFKDVTGVGFKDYVTTSGSPRPSACC
jgi:YesN/AraC family two-component response regulator